MCNVPRTAEDAIINCLKEDEPSWENVFHIPDSTLEKEKLYYNQGWKNPRLKSSIMGIV